MWALIPILIMVPNVINCVKQCPLILLRIHNFDSTDPRIRPKIGVGQPNSGIVSRCPYSLYNEFIMREETEHLLAITLAELFYII